MEKKEHGLLTVGQLAQGVGVAKHVVVHAIQQGLIAPAVRSPAGYRLFRQSQVQELTLVRQLQALGFYANQIKELRALAMSDAVESDKELLFNGIYDRHVEHLKERAEHYLELHDRCVEERDRKRAEVVGR